MQTAHVFRRAFTTNVVLDSFVGKTPTTTKPSGTGVFDLFSGDYGVATAAWVPEFLQLVAFGDNADNETFDLRLWGWSRDSTHPNPIWVPQHLLQVAVTLGNIAATALGTDNFLADTITVTKGADEESGLGASVIAQANDTPASILVGLRGCELIEFAVDIGTAAGGNCLWRAVEQKR